MLEYSRILLETTANTAVTGSQYSPVAAGFAGGGFIVTWLTDDTTQDGSGTAIKAQRYDASGAKVGGEFLVNTQATGNQTAQAVTTLPGGGFVITWQTSDTAQDGSGTAIKAQLFDAAGAKVGAEFLVETNTASGQYAPSITTMADGGFIIAWDTANTAQDGVGGAIKAQRYTAAGTATGAEFLVNSTPSLGSEGSVSITALNGGGFIATYTLFAGAVKDVYARIFDAAGNATGPGFLASTDTQYYQDNSSAVQLAGGNILLSWASVIDASGVIQQRGQIISATGTKIGAEFTLAGTAGMGDANVVALSDGGFAALWSPGVQSAYDGNSLLRLFNTDGSARGGAEVMNIDTTSFEGYSALAVDGAGNLFAGWMTTVGSDNNIKTQVLSAHAGPVITSNGGAGIAYPTAPENQLSVTTIVATNPNGAAQLTYTIVGGGEAAKFTLNSATGVLAFITAPNFESPTSSASNGQYFVTVKVSDGTYSDIQQLAVIVTNVNEPPFWGYYASNYNIAEGATTVGTFTAVDFEQNPISYSLTGTDAGLFTINASTGALSFVGAPNFEAPGDSDGNNVYALTLVASDGSLSASKTLTVTVTNVNEAPVITSDGGGATAALAVAENTAAVTTVASTDPEGTARSYSISGGADAAKFTINTATGVLNFVAAPNFDAAGDANGDNVYEVTVRASDGSLADTQTLSITVTNVNEAPVITSNGGGATAALSLGENSSAVTVVTSTDPENTPRSYSIAGGADAALFAIDAATGTLSFVSAPDRENPSDSGSDNVYEVTVRASDGSLSDTQAIAVTVTNVNEAPSISSNGAGAAASLSIVENSSMVAVVAASDPDGNALNYAITGGADAALFAINAATGALSFVSAPNFEAPTDNNSDNVYQVIVSASDGSLADTQTIAVTVTNQNEAPGFTSPAVLSAAENSLAAGTVAASDPDGNALSYAINGGADAALFAIDAATGALSFVSAPDYEAASDSNGDNIYNLVISASDGSLTAAQALAISVTNVNEAPTIASSAGMAVSENGTAAGTVVAGDPDGTALSYSIVGGADAALFTIDAATGALSFVSAPNYEAPADSNSDNAYQVTVQASDGSLSATQAVTVTVGNVNEAPTISSSASMSAAENGTAVGSVAASDPDGTAVTYSITGGADAAKFAIDTVTGALSFITAPDFETPGDADGNNAYEVTVQASDGSLSDTNNLTVTVTNVNETPVINSGANFAAPENGTAVGTVTASDVDGPPAVFAIVGGADAALFTIDAATGALSFVSAPDYEAPTDSNGDNVYQVTVSASDGSLTDTQTIAVTVGNVNEAPVIAGGDTASASVAENGTAVSTVSASDIDGTAVTYTIVGGTDAAKFTLNAATGALSFVSAPDYEVPSDSNSDNVYQVTVSASDGSLTDIQAISVSVGNVNEAPRFTSPASQSALENATSAGSVAASDPDGNALAYTIVGGADAAKFTIDAQTGALSFISAPNYEAPDDADGNNAYEVTVRASDGSLTAIQAVTVSVGNVNEAPVITSQTLFSVGENGTAVGTVAANDADGNAVTYSISGGADAAKFTINAQTGMLRFIVAPNYEAPTDSNGDNVYQVTVSASDGSLTDTKTLSVAATDVNEAPVITSNSGDDTASITIAENTAAVTTVASNDPEGTARTYSISGGTDAAKFTINAATGALSFIAAPNYEAPADSNGDNVYQVVVVASDGSLNDSQTISVTVGNVNEAPVITSNGGGDSASITIIENTSTVATVASSDPEGTARTYSISGGTDAAKFTINAATGALSFIAAPNYEAPADSNGDNVYQVVVVASDGSLNDSQTISVTVGNVNEAPVITSNGGGDTASITINENTSAVTTLASTDPEGMAQTHSISGGTDAAKFTINAATGALSFVAAPNYEAPTDSNGDNVYQVVVVASDGSLTDSQAISVTIANVIDGVTLTGTTKADTLTGGVAEDTINGLGGNDTLNGGGGADTIGGGDGNDILTGGAGADRLTGGAGADTFVYQALSDSSQTMIDFLTDFSTAQSDKISLSAIDANTGLAGDQAFSWIGTSAFSNVAGQLRYYQSGGDTFVTGDVNGDGVGDFSIQMDPLLTLAANNFVL